jgi:hypothetical protein
MGSITYYLYVVRPVEVCVEEKPEIAEGVCCLYLIVGVVCKVREVDVVRVCPALPSS